MHPSNKYITYSPRSSKSNAPFAWRSPWRGQRTSETTCSISTKVCIKTKNFLLSATQHLCEGSSSSSLYAVGASKWRSPKKWPRRTICPYLESWNSKLAATQTARTLIAEAAYLWIHIQVWTRLDTGWEATERWTSYRNSVSKHWSTERFNYWNLIIDHREVKKFKSNLQKLIWLN